MDITEPTIIIHGSIYEDPFKALCSKKFLYAASEQPDRRGFASIPPSIRRAVKSQNACLLTCWTKFQEDQPRGKTLSKQVTAGLPQQKGMLLAAHEVAGEHDGVDAPLGQFDLLG